MVCFGAKTPRLQRLGAPTAKACSATRTQAGKGITCACVVVPRWVRVRVRQALRQAQEEALAARQAAAAIDRQYKHLRRQHDLDRSKAEMEVGQGEPFHGRLLARLHQLLTPERLSSERAACWGWVCCVRAGGHVAQRAGGA